MPAVVADIKAVTQLNGTNLLGENVASEETRAEHQLWARVAASLRVEVGQGKGEGQSTDISADQRGLYPTLPHVNCVEVA